MKKLKKYTQDIVAAKADMDVKTARKYIQSEDLHIWAVVRFEIPARSIGSE